MIQKRLKQNINTSAIIDNTGNQQEIAQLKIDVANNSQSINTNSQQISTLQTQVTQNTQDITGFNQITTDLETKYNGLEPKVTVNEQNIADIKLDADKIDPLVVRVDNIENKYVKKDESNTFTQINTFNNQTNFKSKIEFRNPTNNNGAYLDNFDYYNQNYTAFKLVKGSTNMLQIECNNTGNYVNISAPGTNNGLHISNVSNPTNNDNATNKGYVDGLTNAISSRVTNIETSLANGNIVNYVGVYDSNTTYKIGQCVTYDNKWYVSKVNSNTNNTPSQSSQQWELLSAPTIDLNAYLTKNDASSTYETIANVNALTTKVTTNETNISTINSTLNSVAKLATDNTFTANNTFNNAITTTGLTTNSNSDLSLTANGSGRIQIQRDMVMNSHWIAGLADPNSPQDAATKHYVDNLLSKNIESEQVAPFKLGTKTVYMKYINEAIRIPNNNSNTLAPIPGLPRIDRLVLQSLTVDNQYILPWYEGSVNLRLVLENNVLKIKANVGAWVNNISGTVYYTKP